MSMQRSLYRLVPLVVVWLVQPALAQLGSLTPPPGAVTETMLPLDSVEPRTPIGSDTTPGTPSAINRITESGSYYLVGNLASDDGKAAILIDAAHVTLDLNGFTVRGGGITPACIRVNAAADNVTIKNGTIRDASDDALLIEGDDAVLVDLRLINNTEFGVNVIGEDCTLRNCEARDNGDPSGVVFSGAFAIGAGARIESCRATGGAYGFWLEGRGIHVQGCNANATANDAFRVSDFGGATFENCSANDGLASGFNARTNSNAAYRDCVARANAGSGFLSRDAEVSYTRCEAISNTDYGFRAQSDDSNAPAIWRDCIARGGALGGISADSLIRATIAGCTVYGGGDSITVGGFGAVVRDCVSHASQGSGIVVTGNAVIEDCSVYSPSGNGISASDGSRVTGCEVQRAGAFSVVLGTDSELSGTKIAVTNASPISVGARTRIADCVFRDVNATTNLTEDCVLERCDFAGNTTEAAITTSSRTVIRACNIDCDGNYAIRFVASTTDHIIDGNHIANATNAAIDLIAGGNTTIIRNTFAGNAAIFSPAPGQNFTSTDALGAPTTAGQNLLLY